VGGAIGVGGLSTPVTASPSAAVGGTPAAIGAGSILATPSTATADILTPTGTAPATGSSAAVLPAPLSATVLPSAAGAGAGPAVSIGFAPAGTIPGITAVGESLSAAGTSVTPSSLTASPGGPVGAGSSSTAPAATPSLYPNLLGD
jgi:hypothetical protein